MSSCARRDGLAPDELRQLAIATRDALGHGVVVVVVGLAPDGTKAGLAVAVTGDLVDAGVSAAEIARAAAKAARGRHGEEPRRRGQGGGPKVDGIDEALTLATELATKPRAPAARPRPELSGTA